MMWHTEDDFIKDIVTLNAFGDTEDEETFAMLRQSMKKAIKKEESLADPNTVIDFRTGEVIDLEEIKLNMDKMAFGMDDYAHEFTRGRGRGSRLAGHYSKADMEIQEQLRKVRPYGSDDRAIEAYCRRHSSPVKTIKKSDAENSEEYEDYNSNECLNDESEPKVKEVESSTILLNTRKSNNALLDSLLSKEKMNGAKIKEECLEFQEVMKDSRKPSDEEHYDSKIIEKTESESRLILTNRVDAFNFKKAVSGISNSKKCFSSDFELKMEDFPPLC